MKKGSILAICLLLGACLGGYSTPPTFYTLTPTDTTAVSDQKRPELGLARVYVARYVDRPQIVIQTPDTAEVSVSEQNRWIAPLSDLIGRITAENLTALLPQTPIKSRTQAEEVFPYTLTLDIVKLDAVLGQTATLDAWGIIQDQTGRTVHRQRITETVAVGQTYDSVAGAYSILMGRMARQIAATYLKVAR